VKIRFLADADLRRAILTGVLRREPNVDFLPANAGGLRGLSDPEVLRLASTRSRVLVSHDVGTMPHHFRTFIDVGSPSPGLILIPQSLDVGIAIDELLLVWQASDASEWTNRILWLPL
jgi:hypothetical protein